MLIWKNDTLLENYENKTYQLNTNSTTTDVDSLSNEVINLIVKREELSNYIYDFYYDNSFLYHDRWVNRVLYWEPYVINPAAMSKESDDVGLNRYSELVEDFYPK